MTKNNPELSDLFNEMSGESKISHETDALWDLQQSLEDEKDKRREERFLWICTILVVFDVDAFSDMQSWAGPITLGIIELLFLIVAGRYFGVDLIYTFAIKCIEKVSIKLNK